MGRGRGDGNTPADVIKIIKELVDKHGQAGTARATGLTRLSIQRFLKGIGYPTPDTLQKLADFTGITFRIEITPRDTWT